MNELSELDTEICEAAVARGEALDRLRDNSDFKALILGNYLDAFGARIVNDFSRLDDTERQRAMQKLIARSMLIAWMDDITADRRDAAEALSAASEDEDEEE